MGESIADFDAVLRKLGIHCEFGATLEESLPDRFVCGLQHEATQRRLLSEPALTYQKALEIAKAMDTADTNTKFFKIPDPPIRKVSRQIPRTGDSRPCRSCGRQNQSREDCCFRDTTCYSCGKRGHIAPACKSTPTQKFARRKVLRANLGRLQRRIDSMTINAVTSPRTLTQTNMSCII